MKEKFFWTKESQKFDNWRISKNKLVFRQVNKTKDVKVNKKINKRKKHKK